jgi:LPXTG-motif cell wall-anchored protein
MPTSTLVIIIGAWLLLAGLSLLAYRFNRDRGDD